MSLVSLSTPLKTENLCFIRKKFSSIGVFLWILRNFQEHVFDRTPLDNCFYFWRRSLNVQNITKKLYHKKHEKSIFEIENYATFEIGRILSEVFDGKKINERILGNMLWEYNHKVMD